MRSPGRCMWTETRRISRPKPWGTPTQRSGRWGGYQQRKRSKSIWEGGGKTNQVKKLFQGEGTEQLCPVLLRGWRGRTGNCPLDLATRKLMGTLIRLVSARRMDTLCLPSAAIDWLSSMDVVSSGINVLSSRVRHKIIQVDCFLVNMKSWWDT